MQEIKGVLQIFLQIYKKNQKYIYLHFYSVWNMKI